MKISTGFLTSSIFSRLFGAGIFGMIFKLNQTIFFSLAHFVGIKIVCKIFTTVTAIPKYNNLGENTVQTNKWCLKDVTTTRYKAISSPRKNKNGEYEGFSSLANARIVHKIGPENVLMARRLPTIKGLKELIPT